MMEIIDKFYVVDFDRCLGNFEANMLLLNEVVGELSIINVGMFQRAHDKVRGKGIPFRVLEFLEENDPNLDMNILQNRYIERAHNSYGSLIESGALELIDFLRNGNHHFCIMTFGEEKWQTTKIIAAGFGDIHRLVVSHERKGDKISEWLDDRSGYFIIPDECFSDKKTRMARDVILIDDKPNAFIDLPIGARGYLVHNEKSVYASMDYDIPNSVKRVACLSDIVRHES